MNSTLVATMLFTTVGGLGLFLLGMKNLSEGIQAMASHQLRALIAAVTSNRLVAVGVGVAFTCMVQSSSVTTVMVVGLVNSAVMTLGQAIGVIIGANIGTTITGWILVIKIGKYGLPLLGVAALVYLFSRNERVRFAAMIVMGVGMVFFGLELMKDGFKPIRSIPEFVTWFSFFAADSYIGVLKAAAVGCILTFLVQSSSATLAITIGLATTGVIEFQTAAALVLGENIGTTITALLASLGASTNAKRAAYAHVVFNVLGVLWITALFPVYLTLVKAFLGVDPAAVSVENGVESFPYVTLGIATVHTGFNVANTLLFIPFIRTLERLLIRLVPDRAEPGRERMTALDQNLLETPMVAIETVRGEVRRMGEITEKMMTRLADAVAGETVNRDFARKLFHREEVLDRVRSEVSIFITDLMAAGLPHDITDEGRRLLDLAEEFESISDYITKIVKLHLRLHNEGFALTDDDAADLRELHGDVTAYLAMVNRAFSAGDRTLQFKAAPQAEAISHKVRRMRTDHARRLVDGLKEPSITMIFSDLLNSYRRVKEHTLNIAETITPPAPA
jgi:phosphate:Na+ symporter